MSIEALNAVSVLSLESPSSIQPSSAKEGFATLLDQVSNLNAQMGHVEQQVQALALGNTQNLHEVMMGIEQSRLQFELLMQVRNKLLEGYQELMRMQV
jgi:flagellar hook-basal body complex protein FliE